MSRISDIILKSRDTLADPSGQRWSTERLLRLVDEAQRDICRQTKILKGKATINIIPGQYLYALPVDCLALDRVVFNSSKLPILSHDEMDNMLPTWEDDIVDTLRIDYIVYDKLAQRQIRIYPIPANNVDVSVDLSGITVSIEGYTLEDLYGVITTVEIEPSEIITVGASIASLVIYYIRQPNKVDSIEDDLDLIDTYDNAIKYYVVGKALRDDMDAQNRTVASEELGFYERELIEIRKDSMYNTTKNPDSLTINYRGAF